MRIHLFAVTLGLGAALAASRAEADDACPRAPDRAKALSARAAITDLMRIASTPLSNKRSLSIVKSTPASVRDGVASLRCDEPALSPKELADIRAVERNAISWSDDFDKKIAAEEKTRAEVVLPLCEAIWGAQNAELMIAQEKSNPGGVVDLAELHRQGDALRYYRQQIAALKPAYKAARGHDLAKWQDEGACVEEAANPQP